MNSATQAKSELAVPATPSSAKASCGEAKEGSVGRNPPNIRQQAPAVFPAGATGRAG